EGAVAGVELIALRVRRTGQDAAAVAGGTHDHVAFLGVAAVTGREALAVGELDALVVATGDDVDHAAHRVRAVDGRGAVGEDLDALNGGHRDGVQILGRAVHRVGRRAPAVDQDQGAAFTQATHAHAGEAAPRGAGARLVRTE